MLHRTEVVWVLELVSGTPYFGFSGFTAWFWDSVKFDRLTAAAFLGNAEALFAAAIAAQSLHRCNGRIPASPDNAPQPHRNVPWIRD